MTPDEVKTLLDHIITEVNAAGDFAGMIDPALIPFITLGKAVDKLIPGVAASVAGWIRSNPPSAQEKADFIAQNAILADPNAP